MAKLTKGHEESATVNEVIRERVREAASIGPEP
jgi:hypothetical protein